MKENRIINLHRSRERILDMVANDGATFGMTINQKHREEYVDVRVEYEICGVHYEKEGALLKLILNVNGMLPAEVDVDSDKLYDMLMADITNNLPFLLKDTYYLSFDMDSIKEVNRVGKLRRFKEELGMAIQSYEFTMDEVLPVVVEYVNDSLSETSYTSIEDMMNRKHRPRRQSRTVLEITPPGVPCPHCNGHLSEDVLHRLLMRVYIRRRGGDY